MPAKPKTQPRTYKLTEAERSLLTETKAAHAQLQRQIAALEARAHGMIEMIARQQGFDDWALSDDSAVLTDRSKPKNP